MPKIKSRSIATPRRRAVAASRTAMPLKVMHNESMSNSHCCNCDHRVDVARCWMCWLFKTLIALFTAFLILWVGFYMGILSMGEREYRLDPALERLLHERDLTSGMSHNMAGASIDKLMGDMTAALKDKSGSEFDKEFLIQMTVHHEGAIEMAKLALEKSQNADIKAFAQKIIDTQTAEITQIKTWQTK